MILTGTEILRQITLEEIKIAPFTGKNLGANSYNLTLSPDLLVYTGNVLDPAQDNPIKAITIPDGGMILYPGRVYLARTAEYTETKSFVPMLIGRSSIGRLGLFVHVTAGFGDTGFSGYWTLELVAAQPIRVYAGMKICQIYYHTTQGEITRYRGKYAANNGVQASKIYEEFQNR